MLGRRRPFEKWEACGNDFIIVASGGRIDEKRACERHYGIGADGVLYIIASEEHDGRMRIVNADGSEAEMCGNGIRCVGQYLSEKLGKGGLRIETAAGVKEIEVEEPYERIRVKMGVAKEQWRRELGVANRKYDASFVNIGNPHCVLFIEGVQGGEVERFGSKIERMTELFPEGTNVEFVTVEPGNPPQAIRVRVWERGCGRTLACGTGACASAYAAYKRGLVGKRVEVKLDGGSVEIELGEAIYMTGPAKRVFIGEYEGGV